MDKKIVIAGSTGFVGNYLKKRFKNISVIDRIHFKNNDFSPLDNADIVINLIGAPIIKRWSKKYKKELLSSRIKTTKILVKEINKRENITHFISSSAIGIYPSNKKCDEYCENIGDDFLSVLSKKWENEALKCNKTTTITRLGLIIGKNGGMLKKILLPFKLGLGGKISDGQFMMSFLSINDLFRIYNFIVENDISGIINAVSPSPVSNKEFTKVLSKILNRPAFFIIPKFMLKLIFSSGASALVSSKEIYPKKLLDLGFKFEDKNIEEIIKSGLAH